MHNLLTIADFSDNMIKTLNDTLGIWYIIILNAFGVFAIVCKILEYQVKSRDKCFILSTVANACWVMYFFLFGNFASALTCVINVVKLLVFMQRGKRSWADSWVWLALFLVAQIIVTVFTVSSWVDVFCITAGFLGIFAYFVSDRKQYRLLSFVHMAVWVANSIANFYLIALLSDSFSTVSCGLAIYRFDIKKQAKDKVEDNKEEQNSVDRDTGI